VKGGKSSSSRSELHRASVCAQGGVAGGQSSPPSGNYVGSTILSGGDRVAGLGVSLNWTCPNAVSTHCVFRCVGGGGKKKGGKKKKSG